MANTIKHKRGSGSDPSASDLVAGELAIRTDTGAVFTKKDDGTVVQVTGSSVGGATGVDFNDNVKARFGTGNDLEIYHDESNSYIKDGGTGSLRVLSNQFAVRNVADTENMIVADQDGAVNVYHNGSGKLATKSDGIDVTGEVQCDSLDVDGDADFGGGKINFDDSGNVLDFADNVAARFGTGNDLRIFHDGSNSRIHNHNVGSLVIKNEVDDQDIVLSTDDSSGGTTTYVRCDGSTGEVQLMHYGTEKLNTKSDGVDITGELQCDSLDVDGSVDITGSIEIDGAIANGTSNVTIVNGANIQLTRGGTLQAEVDGSGLLFQDGRKARFGASADLEIHHNGSDSYIQEVGTGNLNITSNGSAIQILRSNGNNMARFVTAGAVELYHNNAKKLDTKSDGVDITGELQCDSLDVDGSGDITGTLTLHSHLDMQDNDQIKIGSSDDLGIYHDGNNTFFDNYTGSVLHRNYSNDQDIVLQTDNGSGGVTDYIRCDGSNGEVKLYHYGTEKLKTQSFGVDVQGELECDSLDVNGAADISGSLTIGTELNLIGSAGAKYIDANTGDSGTLSIRLTSGGDTGHSFAAQFTRTGAVTLYHNGGIRLRTQSFGVDITGELQCDSLDVDGAGDFTGDVTFRGGAAAVNIAANSDIRFASGTWTGESTKIQHHSNWLYMQGGSNGIIFRSSGGTDRAVFDSSGHFRPAQNNTYDLGTSSLQWRDAHFDGEVNCDGLAVAGSATITSNIDIDGAIRHNGDTNTYIEFNAADTFRVVTAGSERLRVRPSGALAIGGATKYGTSGQVLTSNGDAEPTWQDAGGDGYTAYAFATTERNGSITSSQGFASCTRNGTGNYTLTFSTAVGSTAYTVVIGNEDGDNNYLRRSTKASASITYTSRSTGDQSRDMRQGVVVFKQ